MSASSSPANLKDAIRHLDTLPAMPVIVQKILALDLESDEGERAMLKLIEKDPQIAAKIIGLANTPLFGASRRVSSVADASMLLGITRVKAVTMGIAVMSSLIKKPMGKLDVQGLWLHSLAISLAVKILSQAMPRNTRPLDDEIFLAGLLHDMGYMVLNYLDQKLSDELQTRFVSQPDRFSAEIEAELLEMNHCELGAELARFWNLPDSIIAVLRYHHDPENELAAIGQPLVSMVNIAEKALVAIGISEHGPTEISPEEWQALGIDPSKADELITQINKQAEETKRTVGDFH
ncbi:MAG: HDOD domain-containing protein [Candidatus Nitrotoga sp. LAW]|nr:MAG: HDOD domain-containing protein [Candidatus Nitrotoga sp. LAW]